jgi:hypothetical protein
LRNLSHASLPSNAVFISILYSILYPIYCQAMEKGSEEPFVEVDLIRNDVSNLHPLAQRHVLNLSC